MSRALTGVSRRGRGQPGEVLVANPGRLMAQGGDGQRLDAREPNDRHRSLGAASKCDLSAGCVSEVRVARQNIHAEV